MIRGNIENVTAASVSGWLYADEISVRDRTVLAFLDDRCIGAGRIEHFRQDLADAGLADGVLGFEFPIVLPDAAEAPRVTVRLEGGDAILLQRQSRVVAVDGGGVVPLELRSAQRPLSSLKWMRMQGWLEQSQYDFLRYLDQLGVYEHTLRQPKRDGELLERANLEAAALALSLLQLYCMNEVQLHQQKIAGISELPGLAQELGAPEGFEPLVALWSKERVRICVVEGSHRFPAAATDSATADAGIDYCVGPDSLLFLNPRCTFAPRGVAPAGGIVVFSVGPSGVD